MPNQDPHISDEDLLLLVDGELSGRRVAKVRDHLAACWNCRARMVEIEGTIVDFARAYRDSSEVNLPTSAGPRALLSARLAEFASKPEAGPRLWFGLFTWAKRTAAVGLAVLITVMVGRSVWQYTLSRGATGDMPPSERGVLPDRQLTPGLVRAATLEDLCSAAHEEVVGQVNTPLRNEVLDEYGITNRRASDYEIDYLVAPGLGGTEDIRNLWPQPYSAHTWNAYAKDELEERLHHLVCRRELDLSVAQRDIAQDWITAYKKYFDTKEPMSSTADVRSPQGDDSQEE
jgi:hypothetical protein